jgi:hypothetical protein
MIPRRIKGFRAIHPTRRAYLIVLPPFAVLGRGHGAACRVPEAASKPFTVESTHMPFALSAIAVPLWLPVASGLLVGPVFSPVGAAAGILGIAQRSADIA